MTIVYLRVEKDGIIRKIALDMAFLSSHKIIRLPKEYFEEGLYLLYKKNLKSESDIEKFNLSGDKKFKEDDHFYYFKLPFKKLEQAIP